MIYFSACGKSKAISDLHTKLCVLDGWAGECINCFQMRPMAICFICLEEEHQVLDEQIAQPRDTIMCQLKRKLSLFQVDINCIVQYNVLLKLWPKDNPGCFLRNSRT